MTNSYEDKSKMLYCVHCKEEHDGNVVCRGRIEMLHPSRGALQKEIDEFAENLRRQDVELQKSRNNAILTNRPRMFDSKKYGRLCVTMKKYRAVKSTVYGRAYIETSYGMQVNLLDRLVGFVYSLEDHLSAQDIIRHYEELTLEVIEGGIDFYVEEFRSTVDIDPTNPNLMDALQ